MALVARDLAVTPPGARRPVVGPLSLTVAAGEWLAIAGGNGGGKTSLALALAGLWPASGGTVTLDGEPVAPGSAARARIACVLQDPGSQLLQSTVAAEIAFALHNLGLGADEAARRTRASAACFGLEPDLDRDPRTLSAGRQQLVLVAAAAAMEPALLVADEPTAHLDADARGRVLAWLADALARGVAVCWVSQDEDELARAHRRVRLGDAGPAAPAAAPAPRAGALLAEVRVGADPGGSGPRVRAAARFAFPLSAPGIVALHGPNGAGKSVLLGAIAGLVESPQVEVAWRSPPAAPPILTLQYPELQIFEERVADELLYATRARGRDAGSVRAEAAALLAALGYAPSVMLARRAWELSTGEKRLVEVVAALLAPAGVVLLDEPTAGLDPARRAALAGCVRARAAGTPVVVASQDREWAASLGALQVEVAVRAESGLAFPRSAAAGPSSG